MRIGVGYTHRSLAWAAIAAAFAGGAILIVNPDGAAPGPDILAERDEVLKPDEVLVSPTPEELPVIGFGSHHATDDMRPRAQASGAFLWQPPRPKGKSIRRLPRLDPTGCARNAGEIRALRLGRRKRRLA